MVGLTALLIGGVGVANAVKSHLDRRRDVIATFKALGATGGRVFSIYLTQVLLLALIGAVPGLILGAALPFLVQWAFGAIIPLPLVPSLQPGNLALALIYGLLTALAFALWPLGRAHDVPVSALFRDEIVERPPLAPVHLHGSDRNGRRRTRRACHRTRLRPAHRGDLRRRRGRGVRRAAPGRGGTDGDRAPAAAPALDRLAHGDRQHSPPGRVDHRLSCSRSDWDLRCW